MSRKSIVMISAGYLALEENTATKLARQTGNAVSTITGAAKGDLKPTIELMHAIHEATDGKVLTGTK